MPPSVPCKLPELLKSPKRSQKTKLPLAGWQWHHCHPPGPETATVHPGYKPPAGIPTQHTLILPSMCAPQMWDRDRMCARVHERGRKREFRRPGFCTCECVYVHRFPPHTHKITQGCLFLPSLYHSFTAGPGPGAGPREAEEFSLGPPGGGWGS